LQLFGGILKSEGQRGGTSCTLHER